MSKRLNQRTCALILIAALPAAALAQTRGGGRGVAPQARSVPQMHVPARAGGFNFNRDIAPRQLAQPRPIAQPRPVEARAPVPVRRPVEQQHPAPRNRVVGHNRPPSFTADVTGGPYRGRFHGNPIHSPHGVHAAWGWNHGIAWRPAPNYWGGGFWGQWATASLASAVLFGAIIDNANQVSYPSYEIEPDTPGSDLLNNYSLQQAPCGADNLVVIWGPDNSVICAYPNDTVLPGNYEVDESTFELIPAS